MYQLYREVVAGDRSSIVTIGEFQTRRQMNAVKFSIRADQNESIRLVVYAFGRFEHNFVVRHS